MERKQTEERKCATQDQADDWQGKNQMRLRTMRHDYTTDRHGNRPHHESPRGQGQQWRGRIEQARREIEEQIHHAQSEERDVPKPIHPSFVTRITAEPFLIVKEHAEHHAGDETEQNPQPRQTEIQWQDRIHHCRR